MSILSGPLTDCGFLENVFSLSALSESRERPESSVDGVWVLGVVLEEGEEMLSDSGFEETPEDFSIGVEVLEEEEVVDSGSLENEEGIGLILGDGSEEEVEEVGVGRQPEVEAAVDIGDSGLALCVNDFMLGRVVVLCVEVDAGVDFSEEVLEEKEGEEGDEGEEDDGESSLFSRFDKIGCIVKQ